MAKNDSFKKKELDREEYQGKDTAAKVVKWVLGTFGAVVIIPNLINGVIKLWKKLISKS